jgi:hypothetical protein
MEPVMDDSTQHPDPPLSYAEKAELARIKKTKLEHVRTRHNREALQSLVAKGLVEPGLHSDLTPEGERQLEHHKPPIDAKAR